MLCLPHRKVNTFLSKMNPTELQMASYIDNLRSKQWPSGAAAQPTPPRTAEEEQETKERAHQLINAKCTLPFSLFEVATTTVVFDW